ncbi:hypothetical protein [Catenuloplanes japonicus]|uniref:hypothetical protein n=1 Tax=Catenuloplanes japonicus TaxID=33876 RepID=UPI0005251E7E|nr:hypothetical protein [Catenuloplanes japonicus]
MTITISRISRAAAGAAMFAALVTIPTAPAQAAPETATAGAVGVERAAVNPHKELSGKRIKSPDNDAVYLVDPEGYRRWIPSPAVYDNLFANWNGIEVRKDIPKISARDALSLDAELGKSTSGDRVYLISNNVKRWIINPDVFNKNHFAWKKIVSHTPGYIDSIPTGKNWK